MKYTRELIGSTVIDVSGIEVKVDIYRNENGNLERNIVDEEIYFPNGTCLEGYGEEMQISKYLIN